MALRRPRVKWAREADGPDETKANVAGERQNPV
jgi:hypothetical protein